MIASETNERLAHATKLTREMERVVTGCGVCGIRPRPMHMHLCAPKSSAEARNDAYHASVYTEQSTALQSQPRLSYRLTSIVRWFQLLSFKKRRQLVH